MVFKINLMNKFSKIGFAFLSFFALIMTGCDKTELYETKKADPVAHFVTASPVLSYYVRDNPLDSFIVQIGTSDVASVDRTVTYNISSPTGAVEGTDYEIVGTDPAKTVTIKAGSAIANLKIHGKFDSYSGGTKDTLVISLAQPSLTVAKFLDTVRVVLQPYCDVVLDDFLGDYSRSFDIQTGQPTYGPYAILITSATTNADGTSGYVMINNVWDVGGPDVRVNLDWSNPANFNTTIPAQFLYKDGTYGDATITGVGTGSFSSCEGKISLSYRVTVAAGSFGNFTTTIAR